MPSTNFRAAVLDLDGVVTRTAGLHARAWKEMLDAFLRERTPGAGEDLAPFDVERDYLDHVDGKPRLDGLRSFLKARGIRLSDAEIAALGERKNEIFLRLLDTEPVERFEGAVQQIRRWRDAGLATALITSSRNGRRILKAAGVEDLFDVTVDGNDAERLGIPGKPAPDVFLHAARALGVQPRDAIVVEDAISGVRAGRAGGFGLVVGVSRSGADALLAAGADLVVGDLREIPPDPEPAGRPAHALERFDTLLEQLGRRRPALFFDYDGTLTPIVRRPDEAVLSDEMRALLRELARRVPVAVISGRDLADVREMVGLEEVHYAGSHGFDVAGPGGLRMEQRAASGHLRDLDSAEAALGEGIGGVEGAWVERKRFAIAVHYREAAAKDEAAVEALVDDVLARHPRLRKKSGKKIFELQPDIAWDKGRAVEWLLEELGLRGGATLPVYVGDDTTDEDAFRALAGHGVGIRVGAPDEPTHAALYLRDPEELASFCRELLKRLPTGDESDG